MNRPGFGYLRLPFNGSEPDYDMICGMTGLFIERGGKYFDTCCTYLSGMSEEAVKRCLFERKDRDSFELCDKIPGYMCSSKRAFRRFFEEETKRCGTYHS